jgi:hypothetical protein
MGEKENEEVDIGRRHEAARLYGKQFIYYTISRPFIDINGIIVSYSSPLLHLNPHTEPQLAAHVINAKQDWEVRKIIGKEDIDGVLPPEHSLGHVKELVDKFEAQLRAQREANNGRGGRGVASGG